MFAASANDSVRSRVARTVTQAARQLEELRLPKGEIAFHATPALIRAQNVLAPVFDADDEEDLSHALEVLVYEGKVSEIVLNEFFAPPPEKKPGVSGRFSRTVSLRELVYRSTKNADYTNLVADAFDRVQLLLYLQEAVEKEFEELEDEAQQEVEGCVLAPEIAYARFRESYAYLCAGAVLVRVSDRATPGWRERYLVDELVEALSDPIQLLASLLPEEREFSLYALHEIDRPKLDIVSIVNRSIKASGTINTLARCDRRVDIGEPDEELKG